MNIVLQFAYGNFFNRLRRNGTSNAKRYYDGYNSFHEWHVFKGWGLKLKTKIEFN